MFKRFVNYFSKFELTLWGISIILILASFIAFDRVHYLTLCASLIGATSLIFNAKGNPTGQVLMIAFSILYGIISYRFAYYGEMITYLGMTMPMSIFSLISWIKHPNGNNKAEVKINQLKPAEIILMFLLTIAITILFYFILKHFNTANLFFSTVSIATSFAAVYLTFRRSTYFALAYAFNDIVLIILWIFAAVKDISYLSVIICFIVFLTNDVYGFFNWQKMKKRQAI